MTVQELWKEHQFYTGNLTEHARKMAFAGVAVCWLFKDANYTFPALIYLALFGFIAYFLFDTLQYFVAAIRVRNFTEKQEQELRVQGKPRDTEIVKPRSVDKPVFWIWIFKYCVLLAAFAVVGLELLWKLLAAHL